MRAYLIDRQIEDVRQVLIRQTMFAEFEQQVHEIEENGGPLTLNVFSTVYRDLLNAYFGPRFTIDDELSIECLRIPHFYSAFYVYKYATGISAALSLTDRVLTGGLAEVEFHRVVVLPRLFGDRGLIRARQADDRGTLAREGDRNRAADASTRSGNDCYLSREPCHRISRGTGASPVFLSC